MMTAQQLTSVLSRNVPQHIPTVDAQRQGGKNLQPELKIRTSIRTPGEHKWKKCDWQCWKKRTKSFKTEFRHIYHLLSPDSCKY